MSKKREEDKTLTTQGLDSREKVEQAFAAASYTPGQSVTEAENALKEWQNARPQQYQSSYQGQIDSLLNQLTGRQDFAYSYQNDPLYKQYAQTYTQNARNASADAAAQAAALTGGYGSSYAVSAAQQAYQQQMNGLNGILPTLYQLALDTYTSEGDQLVTGLEQLTQQEQNARQRYEDELSDYYTQLEQKGEAYNNAYAQDYAQYQNYLNQLDSLYGYYSQQEQQQSARRQQTFNNVMSVLGLVGDAVQLLITGTTGLGSMAGSLVNTGYNIYADNRDYEAQRADTAWSQKMEEQQRQDALTQQQYENQQAQQEYQDSLRQQQYANAVTSEKLNIAKGEWALKQAKAQQTAARASTAAAGTTATPAAQTSGTASLSVGKSGTSTGTSVPYTAARMRSAGRSDSAIRTALLQEGYTGTEIQEIMRQLNS